MVAAGDTATVNRFSLCPHGPHLDPGAALSSARERPDVLSVSQIPERVGLTPRHGISGGGAVSQLAADPATST